MTPPASDWASDLAIDILVDAYRHPYLLAQKRIAARLRELRRDVVPCGDDDDHD